MTLLRHEITCAAIITCAKHNLNVRSTHNFRKAKS